LPPREGAPGVRRERLAGEQDRHLAAGVARVAGRERASDDRVRERIAHDQQQIHLGSFATTGRRVAARDDCPHRHLLVNL
jgi:hypothetical protein